MCIILLHWLCWLFFSFSLISHIYVCNRVHLSFGPRNSFYVQAALLLCRCKCSRTWTRTIYEICGRIINSWFSTTAPSTSLIMKCELIKMWCYIAAFQMQVSVSLALLVSQTSSLVILKLLPDDASLLPRDIASSLFYFKKSTNIFMTSFPRQEMSWEGLGKAILIEGLGLRVSRFIVTNIIFRFFANIN